MIKYWGYYLVYLICFSACSWQTETKPSLLVIAIDHLGAQDVSCQESINENEQSGFQTLCAESVRFTHAYSTSPMAQSAAVSMLTGLAADSHGVWHNGNQFLSGKVETVAEVADKKGYKTSFFSGGPPIWSKSGLRQGFEIFDDNISLGLGRIYRPISDSLSLFLNWLGELDDNEPFFSVLYVPDLSFTNYSTTSELGEARKVSFEGQLQEIDESLLILYKELFKRKRWNNTNIVVVGLSGHEKYDFRDYISSENLFSENTQVSLLIKSARKNPERGGSWKIDKNVSISDLGYTLFEFVGGKGPKVPDNKIESISLLEALSSPQVSWVEERPLFSTTGWPSWMNWGDNKSSIRSGYFLILLKQPLVMFNTLTDKFENSGQLMPSNYWPAFLADISKKSVTHALRPWAVIPKEMISKIRVVKDLFLNTDLAPELKARVENGVSEGKFDYQVLSWAALRSVQYGDWEWLLKLSEIANKESWKIIAKRGLGEKVDWSTNPCLGLMEKKVKDVVYQAGKLCEEPLFADLLMWIRAKEMGVDSESARETFIHNYQSYLLAREIGVNNYLSDLAWDVDQASPTGPMYSELVLGLPENKSFLNFVKKRLSYKY